MYVCNKGEGTHLKACVTKALHVWKLCAGETSCHLQTTVQANLLTVGTERGLRNNMRCPFSTFALMNMQYRAFLLECAKCWEEYVLIG